MAKIEAEPVSYTHLIITPNLSRRGPVSCPALVVAPIRVNLFRSTLIAVSYTHLCRAHKAYTALHHGEGVWGFGKDAEIAVSYTHLDVYKRQGLTRSALNFTPTRQVNPRF